MDLSLETTDVPELLSVRVAERGDHVLRTIPTQGVAEIRSAHHRVAAMVANDYKTADITRLTGFSRRTIEKLQDNPAFKDLVAHYSLIREERLNELQSRAEVTSLRLLDELDERLDSDEVREKIPFNSLSDTLMKMLDRAGQGPVRKLDARVASINFTPQTLEAIRDAAGRIDPRALASGGLSELPAHRGADRRGLVEAPMARAEKSPGTPREGEDL